MIPKKIHYCWLSGEKMPEDAISCMKSWQKMMPEYELVLWDTNRFDVNSVPFVAEAVSVKKWAFAADYIRLYALYTEGGIYLDTDVFVRKSFTNLLDCGFLLRLNIITALLRLKMPVPC
jgi:mannosyltransferase OCH1-like enzyme